ncbi:MAG: ATP-binding cassette domain-containing protein [Rhizobiaceae bacterium]
MSLEAAATPLLAVKNLGRMFPSGAHRFGGKGNLFKAVDNVSFNISSNETLGLVGESGSGKSTIGRAVLMLPPPTSGSVKFEGTELVGLPASELRRTRRRMQVVFQDPFAALNPRMSIGAFISEPLEIHNVGDNPKVRGEMVAALLAKVGLDPAMAARYPHQFSGGQRQRIAIARAIALRPSFIVADEPTSALDVSIQAQVVNLLQDLQAELGLSFLFISHDLRLVRHVSHRIGVLRRGRLVELASTAQLFNNPRHPYTRRLMSAIRFPDPVSERSRIIAADIEAGMGGGPSELVEAEAGHFVEMPV